MPVKFEQWTLEYQRSCAIGATRSYLRQMEIDPFDLSGKEALVALDDLCRILPKENYAKNWYLKAKDYQFKIFIREWEQWRRKNV